MTTQPPGDVGISAIAPVGAAAFAVTAPPELTLAADRTGQTSFTVTNVTGRPVRARLIPKGQSGAQDAWLAVVGEPEVPMSVGSTVTVTVMIKVPADVGEGRHTLRLEVVAEDDTETVAGQSVSFTVPPAVVVARKRFPWLLLIIIGVVVLLGIAAAVFFVSRPTSAPENFRRPAIIGTPTVGQPLIVDDGQWKGDDPAFSHEWFRCQPTVDDCVTIDGATASGYTPVSSDQGQRLQVRVTGSDRFGSSSADSELVGPVVPGAPVIPDFTNRTLIAASRGAAALGLNVSTVVAPGTVFFCPRRVVAQSLAPGTPAVSGDTIVFTISPTSGFCR